MRAIRRLAVLGATAMLCTLGSCIPERDTTPALYTQYAVEEPESSDGVHCFYDCLRWPGGAARDSCLSQCDGMAVNVTREPCVPPAPRLCTYEPVPVAESAPEDDHEDVAAAIIGGIFRVAIAAVTHAGDADREHASMETSERTAHHESTRHHQPAVSGATPERRSYVVERPRPEPQRKPRTPST